MTAPNPSRRAFLQSGGALGLAALLWPESGQAQQAGPLRIRSYADIQVLDPAFSRAAPEGDISSTLYRRLVRYKSATSWEWELDAAEKIEQVDPKTVTFTLKPGIKWTGDFGEMTAEDVKFSYERIANPDNKSPYRGDWATLDQVEVTGPLSGIIRLKQPFAPLWASTLPWNSGHILCKKAVEGVGGKFTTQPPATCGAYLLKSWQPKQRTILVRNPDYTGPPPVYDEIHVLPIEDAKSAELAYNAKELDHTAVAVTSILNLKKSLPPATKLEVRPSLAYVWMGMNTEAPPFDDIRVRKAVQKAVDVEAVLDAAYFGAADRSTGLIAPGMTGHRDIKPAPRDVAGAKKLLAEAGKSGGFDCTIDIMNITERLSAAQVIQANLAEVGIKVQINVHDSGAFWTLGDASKGDRWKKLQLVISRYSMAPDPSWAMAWFTPAQVGVWNWERWNSTEFDAMNKAALIETDIAKRAAIYVKMQDMMEDSGAYLFLTNEVSGVIHRDSVAPGLMPDGRSIFTAFKRA